MRRITSKYQENKRRKRNQLIIGSVLIFVMFSSVLGFAFSIFSFSGGDNINSNDINSVNYNGFEFKEQNSFWILNKNNINFIFRNNPHEVPRINSELKNLDNYNGKPLYIFSESIESESEIYTNLAQFVERVQNACLENQECDENLPVKTCEDNFIIIKEVLENETPGITQQNNCVFIKGKKVDLVRLADEFLFKILGVES